MTTPEILSPEVNRGGITPAEGLYDEFSSENISAKRWLNTTTFGAWYGSKIESLSGENILLIVRALQAHRPERIAFANIPDPNSPYFEGVPEFASFKTLEKRFYELANQWENETAYLPSLGDVVTHPAYRGIISMGKPVLPLILSELREKSRHWFHALAAIVGTDIGAGVKTFADARAAWLTWGYENNYL